VSSTVRGRGRGLVGRRKKRKRYKVKGGRRKRSKEAMSKRTN